MKKLIFYASIVLFILGYNDANAQCPTGADIHVANDVSGSVSSIEYQQAQDFITTLSANFGNAYGTANNETRISISSWSRGTSRFEEYNFPSAGPNYTTDIGDILSYGASARPFSGGTDVYTALLRAREWVNQNPFSGRTVPKIIILLTDASCGQVKNGISDLATQIKDQGVFIVLLAIDNASSCTNLSGTNIASPGAYFSAVDYTTLRQSAIGYINSILNVTCPGFTPLPGPPVPPPPLEPPPAPAPPFDLTGSLSNFEITNCNTTAVASADIVISNSGGEDFNDNLKVSYYSGNPFTTNATYLFTEDYGTQTIPPGGNYNTTVTNTSLVNYSDLFALVNFDGAAAGNEVPLPYNALRPLMNISGEGNPSNNLTSASRTNGTGCPNAFASIETRVTNSGVGCDDEAIYTVEVCNTGSADALMTANDITAYAPAGFNLLDQQLVGNDPFVEVSNSWPITYLNYGVDSYGVADFNNDGLIDIQTNGGRAASNNNNCPTPPNAQDNANFTYTNNGGTFNFTLNGPQEDLLAARADNSGVLFVDMNGDGFVDMVGATGQGPEPGGNVILEILYNDGTGNFPNPAVIINNTQPSCGNDAVDVQFGDIDKDGDIDLVTGAALCGNLAWYRNDGGNNFTDFTLDLNGNYSTGTFGSEGLALEDFDGDGNLDILANFDDFYKGDGSGGFTLQNASAVAVNGVSADYTFASKDSKLEFVADFNNDGFPDIASGNGWFENNGNGTFTGIQFSIPVLGSFPAYFGKGNFDNDGDTDILSAVYVSGFTEIDLYLIVNDGAGNFTLGEKVLANIPQEQLNPFVINKGIADFDNDGDLDFFYGGASTSLFDPCSEQGYYFVENRREIILPEGECATFQYTYDVSAGSYNNYSVATAATNQPGDDPVTFSPDTNFGSNNLNGFDGSAQTSDDLTYGGGNAACGPGDQISVSLVMTGDGNCPGDFSTATVEIENNSGLTLSNTLLTLDLTGTDASFNGEPYDLTNGLRLAEPNVFDPSYPGVPNALSQQAGQNSLDIFTLPDGTSTFKIEIIIGNGVIGLSAEVSGIPEGVNASGSTSGSNNITSGTQPVISSSACPSAVTVSDTEIVFSGYSSTNANSILWTSGTNGSFNNSSLLNPTYTINDNDKANGFVEFSLEVISGDGCSDFANCRVDINGVPLDYGDAPGSYDFNENEEPVAAASTINSEIYLGSTPPDTDNLAQPSTNATDDDTNGNADEDGLNTTTVFNVKPGQTFTITVTATNNDSSRPAYLNAFIDWNTDGDFLGDEGENSDQVVVPENTGLDSYTLNFTVPANLDPNLSDVFVRLRLSTDELAAARTFGASANGEVEDFQIQSNVCLPLNLKVYLAGALIDNGGATGSNSEPLMRDNLRSSAIPSQLGNNVLPTLEPYTALAGFTHVGAGGGRSATAMAFDDRGQNSVVDWVFIEFRDKNDNTTVLETMSALVQRDGDIVDIDGVSPIQLCTTESEYYVAVRHRNHLGVMTALAEDLKVDNTVDFTDNNVGGSGVFNYGTSHPVGGPAGFDYTGLSQQSAFNFAPLPGGVNALWAGNSSGDDKIKFESPDDDLNTMLFSVLLFPGNSSFQPSFDFALTYDVGDLDMNGKVKFESPDDDQNFLLFQVLLHPLNNTFQSSFDFIFEQLP